MFCFFNLNRVTSAALKRNFGRGHIKARLVRRIKYILERSLTSYRRTFHTYVRYNYEKSDNLLWFAPLSCYHIQFDVFGVSKGVAQYMFIELA